LLKQAKALKLLCGLAGSLRLEDIPKLMPYNADYLGFRGALCQGHDRVGQLNKQAVIQIRRAIKNLMSYSCQSAFSYLSSKMAWFSLALSLIAEDYKYFSA